MVNKNKLKLTLLQQEILSFLFEKASKSFNARTIAKNLKVSPPAIAKALPKLQKENLITIEKEAGRLSIELNRDNRKIIQLKRVHNLKTIYESNIIEFLEDKFPGSIIILFGSYSKGEDTLNSDIDIAIIEAKEKPLSLEKFEEILDREIIIQFYPSLKEIHKNLRSNILNGIILKGGVEI
jgi:predicted nucleotidyltransferase